MTQHINTEAARRYLAALSEIDHLLANTILRENRTLGQRRITLAEIQLRKVRTSGLLSLFEHRTLLRRLLAASQARVIALDKLAMKAANGSSDRVAATAVLGDTSDAPIGHPLLAAVGYRRTTGTFEPELEMQADGAIRWMQAAVNHGVESWPTRLNSSYGRRD